MTEQTLTIAEAGSPPRGREERNAGSGSALSCHTRHNDTSETAQAQE
jgi:hypothetical protein